MIYCKPVVISIADIFFKMLFDFNEIYQLNFFASFKEYS